MNAENDRELISFGIGFTNIVERTTRANQELSRQEIEEGEIKCTLDKIKLGFFWEKINAGICLIPKCYF